MKMHVCATAGLMLIAGMLAATLGLLAVGADAPERLDVHILGWPVGQPAAAGKPGGGVPSQPAETIPWGITHINADDVWSNTTGAGVNVAVLDTGIQADHPDLTGNVKGGRNFACNSPVKCDRTKWGDGNGHGTHVAGTVGALDNAIGVVGVAPSVNLYAYKVLTDAGSGSWSWLAEAIDYATATRSDADATNDIDVITMSLGGAGGSSAVSSAVAAADAAGIVLVAAAGNAGDGSASTDELSYPAAYAGVIGVGAIDASNAAPAWSSSGPHVDVAAPGVSVLSTSKGSGYATLSGTSMATPHVTGVVALLLTTTPGAVADTNSNGVWDPSEVRSRIASTSVDLGATGRDAVYGDGRIDAAAAVL